MGLHNTGARHSRSSCSSSLTSVSLCSSLFYTSSHLSKALTANLLLFLVNQSCSKATSSCSSGLLGMFRNDCIFLAAVCWNGLFVCNISIISNTVSCVLVVVVCCIESGRRPLSLFTTCTIF